MRYSFSCIRYTIEFLSHASFHVAKQDCFILSFPGDKIAREQGFLIWKSGDFLLARRSLETSPNNPANLRSTECC